MPQVEEVTQIKTLVYPMRYNNWIYKNGTYQWTLTSMSVSPDSVFGIYSSGIINGYLTNSGGTSIFPSIYLNANITISNGTGSSFDPFILSL